MKPSDRPWTAKEIARLRELAHLGAGAVAEALERSVMSVKLKAHRQRISLRRPDSHAGSILGQPRGVSWTSVKTSAGEVAILERIRTGALDGTVDVAKLERRAQRLYDATPLCPGCARHPQEVASTGLCEECHLRALAQAHRDEDARQDAQRELWRERQAKVRRQRRQEGARP